MPEYPESYILPEASNNELGGIKADEADDSYTVEVKKNEEGKLFVPTYPEVGSGSGGGGAPGTPGRGIEKIELTDTQGLVDTYTITYTDGTTTTYTVTNGEDGTIGATPNVQIGQVTTLEPGQQATASMTGTPENPLLNLGIPRGAKGDPGEGGGGDSYTLPIMSDTQLGGGKAVVKTDEDVPVAVDPSTGQLFVPTYPSGGEGAGELKLLKTIETVAGTSLYEFNEDEEGEPFSVSRLFMVSSNFIVESNYVGTSFNGNSTSGKQAFKIWYATGGVNVLCEYDVIANNVVKSLAIEKSSVLRQSYLVLDALKGRDKIESVHMWLPSGVETPFTVQFYGV